jgi:hypothetical protein
MDQDSRRSRLVAAAGADLHAEGQAAEEPSGLLGAVRNVCQISTRQLPGTSPVSEFFQPQDLRDPDRGPDRQQRAAAIPPPRFAREPEEQGTASR